MRRKRIISVVISLALVILLGGELLLSLFAIKADAADGTSTTYSNALDDLKKDSNFNPDDYPDKPDDYSLQVITVAEGENGELFVYVYQPSNATKDLRAAKINMALQEPADKDILYEAYDLTWLNSNGVFDKYLVNDFTILDDTQRYYSIAAIYRTFDATLGDKHEAGKDDITGYKSFLVAQYWGIYRYNGIPFIESKELNVVKCEINSVGYTRYWDGFGLLSGVQYCDSHFIAFSITDPNFKEIEWVYDVTVTYQTRPYEFYGYGGIYTGYKYTEEASTEKGLKVSEGSEGYNDPNIPLFSKKYTWNRIVATDTFISETEDQTNKFVDEDSKKNLNNAQYVVRFLETERYEKKATTTNGYDTYTGIAVSNVGLVQLHFLADKQEYNLGVVADIVSDDGNPDFYVGALDNLKNNIEETMDWLKVILRVVVLIFLFTVFSGPVTFILRILYDGFKFIVKIAWWLVTLPFRIIAFFFK